MTSRFTELVVDANDPRALANFWCAVLEYEITGEKDGYIEIGSQLTEEQVLSEPCPPTIVFVPVSEKKDRKVRIHIDVSPIDRSQEQEVERLVGLGATRVDIGQGNPGWVVMADPEGNEFCVLRSLFVG